MARNEERDSPCVAPSNADDRERRAVEANVDVAPEDDTQEAGEELRDGVARFRD